MANPRHDRTTGRFVSKARRRVQAFERIANQPDEDYALDEEAMVILEAGMARAVKDGWRPPDSTAEEISTEVTR